MDEWRSHVRTGRATVAKYYRKSKHGNSGRRTCYWSTDEEERESQESDAIDEGSCNKKEPAKKSWVIQDRRKNQRQAPCSLVGAGAGLGWPVLVFLWEENTVGWLNKPGWNQQANRLKKFFRGRSGGAWTNWTQSGCVSWSRHGRAGPVWCCKPVTGTGTLEHE